MPIPRILLPSVLALLASLPLRATQFYVSQSGAGSGDALSPANAGSARWFNAAANWGDGPGRIGPGDTVHLEGTISRTLRIQASGAPGRVITILFDPGASMQRPVWPAATGAIDINGKNHLTIDGGATGIIGGPRGNPALVNGFIANTANGTELDHQSPSIFICAPDASALTIRNLGLYNLYVRTSPTDEAPDRGGHRNWSAIASFGNSATERSNVLVTNCLIHDAYCGFFAAYTVGCSDFEYSFCTTYRCNWGGICGDTDRAAALSGLLVHDDNFRDFANWDDTGGANNFHHDGFFVWGVSGGTATAVRMYNNVVGPNFGAFTAGGLFAQGWVSDVVCYNNIFKENPGDRPDDGLIYLNPYPDIEGVYSAFNNTFIGGGAGTGVYFGPDAVGRHLGQRAQTINIENNLFAGVATAIALYQISGPIAVNVDYNLGYNLDARAAYSYSRTNSSVFKTLGRWRGLGYDIHGVNGDPALGPDYRPAPGSPAVAAGADLSALGYLTTDFAGSPRPGGVAWDVGAMAGTGR